MAELRRDLTTGRDVVVAAERARRPEAFRRTAPAAPLRSDSCPFCPGREHMTPPPVVVVRGARPGSWRLRIVPNKFAAFRPDAHVLDPPAAPFIAAPARGRHEVVVETPDHGADLVSRPAGEIAEFLQVCAERWRDVEEEESARAVFLFRNRGVMAGASLEHPHSQLVALPVVPPGLERRLTVAAQARAGNGEDLYARLLDAELADGRRVLAAGTAFVTFAPFAAAAPFELWIVPRQPVARFTGHGAGEWTELAGMLKAALCRLDRALGHPDYNWVVLSAPARVPAPGFRWHLRIVPRLTVAAGFELGAEMPVNIVRPEDAAELLRRHPPGGEETGHAGSGHD